MKRIDQCLQSLNAEGRSALIPYITAGDPDLDTTVALMHAMVESGADIIELGVPFSDPMADGPVIQAACERALARGVTLNNVLDCVGSFREKDKDTPVVVMGYLNPVESMGYETFAQRAEKSGVDGVLLVDLTVEEADAAVPCLKAHNLAPVFLIAPTSPDSRVAQIGQIAEGYLYYVSLKGVTGASNLDVVAVTERLDAIKKQTDLPIAVGFGIRDADSAAEVAKVAEAVVVGSTLVSVIEQLGEDTEAIIRQVAEILGQMRQSMDRATR